jgi:hypothetical protein
MATRFTNSELESYLDEALPVEKMTAHGRRDAGVHSLGEIWRRHRLSCPTREQLGSFLLGVLPRDAADYVKFHVETIQCRYCTASLGDLKGQQEAAEADVAERRRQKYFQSSVGHLRKR